MHQPPHDASSLFRGRHFDLDGYPATHAAVAELKERGVLRPQAKVRTSQYLNNLIEQDHRKVKQRIYPMLGFKKFANASVAIRGRVPHVWEAVLAA